MSKTHFRNTKDVMFNMTRAQNKGKHEMPRRELTRKVMGSIFFGESVFISLITRMRCKRDIKILGTFIRSCGCLENPTRFQTIMVKIIWAF